jgi:hypothetical protein
MKGMEWIIKYCLDEKPNGSPEGQKVKTWEPLNKCGAVSEISDDFERIFFSLSFLIQLNGLNSGLILDRTVY